MADPVRGEFARYFEDVHGYEPFPWQERLTGEVLESGRWPEVIDLPTGTGKTAVLDTAIFSLAVRPETFPRRVVFVIDRRIVVDQVHERALRIRERIREGGTAVLKKVREGLGGVGEDEPLGVAALRGGIPIDNEWTHRPDLPWVVVSTVDQFGSRLLFRGYGVSSTMRPIHAGLAGNDCLVILDEVRLSKPFAQTLASVRALDQGPLPRRFQVVEMSATPSAPEAARFELLDSDLEASDELRRRVQTSKVAAVRTLRGKVKPPHESLPPAVLRILRKELPDAVRCVGVVVNRVRTAREIHRSLLENGYAGHLVTGRMRPIDRRGVIEAFAASVQPDREVGTGDLTVVVSTQAIEVGADFSFDALITECAPVDSLRRRFGRLDRRGRFALATGAPAKAWILGVASTLDPKKPDPIYGATLRATWEELERLTGRRAGRLVDVGPTALRSFPEGTTAPRPDAPLLLTTHLEAWVQTNPEPVVQPSVDSLLHGVERAAEPDVALVWRWDRHPETLRLVPPRPPEHLPVPIGAARSWLSEGAEVEVADVDVPAQRIAPAGRDRTGHRYTRWKSHGEDGVEEIRVEEIRPGDVIIVDPTRGGIRGGAWDPSSTEVVEDLGDAAQLCHGKRVTLRLDGRTLRTALDLPSPLEEADADASRRVRIEAWSKGQEDLPTWARTFIDRTGGRFDIHTVHADSGETPYYVLAERTVDPGAIDGSDRSASVTGAGTTLRSHLDGVGDRAADFARRLGFTDRIQNDLRLAGRLHDVGKVDSRFQKGLVGGDEVDLALLTEPLAKSLPGRSRRRFYPKGMRHEIASVSMALSNPSILRDAYDRDLVLHLVGTHHGYGRPLPPIVEDTDQPHTLRFEHDGHAMETSSDLVESSIGLDMAERFWRLTERYGYYGLAWLETVLRLADHRQSAEERLLVEKG